jgi:hypothetical protein
MRVIWMRTIARIFAISCALCLGVWHASAQGTFQNLNFEAANVPLVPTNQFGADVATSNGIPGWTAYIGGSPVTTILHNNEYLGNADVAILGPQWYGPQILQGRYTVQLKPSSAGPPTSTAIGQTGLVPMGAESLTFYGDGAYDVTFGGQEIPLVTLATTPNYSILGGDISAFDNQIGELRIQGGGLVDNIVFSTQSIPEPSVVSLAVVAAAICCVWSRRRAARADAFEVYG